jgi:uncharacterized protein
MRRRTFLKTMGTAVAAWFGTTGYAVAVEPFRLRVQEYRINPHNWTPGLRLKVAALADIHACDPWMSVEQIRYIVARTNALSPDVVVLLGDYVNAITAVKGTVAEIAWAKELAALSAPHGVHAILGNHDWWEDRAAQWRGHGPVVARLALESVGIPVYENRAVRLEKDGQPFWLAGLGDQLALKPDPRKGRFRDTGIDDLPGTLAQADDDAPLILLAHEPDIFVRVPDRVALTLAGHTHGGQFRAFGYSPVVPSNYGNQFAYGHVTMPGFADEAERHMIVSGGLGCSILPVRFGVPPEIVLVELSAPDTA